jgi:predicted ATP-grasp superfamily ATP-dependent carboligase
MAIVGVTAIGQVNSPSAGLGTGRCLKVAGHQVIGITNDYRTPAICLPYFDDVKVIDSMFHDSKKFLSDLKKVKEITGIEVLIPGYDNDVKFFIKIKKEIENLGIKLLLPSEESFKKSMKENLIYLRDIPMIKTEIVYSREEVEIKAKKVGWPQVCKGPVKDAYIAKDLEMTKMYCQHIKDWWCGGRGKVIIQDFIVGDYFAVAGFCSNSNELLDHIQIKKLGINIKDGSTWSGISIFDSRLEELTKKIISQLNWIGPFELEFVYDDEKKDFFLFEINPRLTGWIYLSVGAGNNIPNKIVKITKNPKSLNTSRFINNYKKNIAFTRITEEVICHESELDASCNLYKNIIRKQKGGYIKLKCQKDQKS